ncbi:ferredoxin [Amorphoplanes nipponensis]|uniref:Ferredoxin n=1 Tax=Actinoplanes nipponensis TaxID=135950 RepID=A0A919JJN4_9ACTN|nr:ferredoxin [Actinoplanes nipponensis]GIE51791.1 ferredoxin [Actinoplanes nipponensis]
MSAPEAAWRLAVDPDTCIGSGMCAGIAPALFALDDGISVPLRTPIAPDQAAIDAAESCPVEAIIVRDAADGHVVAPEQ